MRSTTLREMIREGTLPVGTRLVSRGTHVKGVSARIVREGIDVGGHVHTTPTGAARSVAGYSVNGWNYWRVASTGHPLSTLRPGRPPASDTD